jgi:hypothetical protein
MALVPGGFVTPYTALYPEFGNGVFIGRNPGSSNLPPGSTGYGGGDTAATQGVTIQTDANSGVFLSTMSAQPQNVLRLTGQNGVGFIQGTNIRFSLPFSAAAGVAILPGSGTMNVGNLAFVSTLMTSPNGVSPGGAIDMVQLTSSIQGYGWANVA